MIPFAEIQFPPKISYGSKGGPMFSTEVVASFSGYEQRNINWSQARARYDVSSGVKTQEQMQELMSFFLARRGRAVGFRFKDWSDYQGKNQFIGFGDGKSKDFQLVKRYFSENKHAMINFDGEDKQQYAYQRIIHKPVQNDYFRVYKNSVLVNGGFEIDYTKGIVKFNRPPEPLEAITVDFEFDVPVRFDTDHLDGQIDSFQVNSWNNIPLLEIRI